MARCIDCGGEASRNKPRCRICEDAYWISRPVEHRPWAWTRAYVIRRDGQRCRGCNRKRQQFNPDCLVLRATRRELGRDLTNEEIALILGIPVDELYLQLTVHHKIHRSQGGTDDLDNLVTLCRTCHDREHNQSPKGGKSKRRKKRA